MLMGFYQQGRNERRISITGIEMALQRILADPEFVFRKEAEPANVAAGQKLSHQRSGTGLAAVVLPVEQHSGRRADQRWPARTSCTSRRCWSSRCGACWPIRARTSWWSTSPGSG